MITRGYGVGLTCEETTHCKKDLYALDFARDRKDSYGQPVLAVADGEILFINSYDVWGGGYGYFVKIQHPNGLISLYAHLSEIDEFLLNVRDDKRVWRGQILGKIGNTGNVFPKPSPEEPLAGTHLHFAMYQRQPNGTLVAYKPEPMSGYTNFLAGNWYVSDNEIFDPNKVLAQTNNQENNIISNTTLTFWQKIFGAMKNFWQSFTQPIIQLVSQFSKPNQHQEEKENLNIQKQENEEIYSAKIISQSEKNLILKPNEITTLSVTIKNTGNLTWQAKDEVAINTFNEDSKKFYHPSWLTRKRPVISKSQIQPNQNLTFSFKIQAPNELGTYFPSFQISYRTENGEFKRIKSDLISWQIIVNQSLSEHNNNQNLSDDQENTNQSPNNLRQNQEPLINNQDDRSKNTPDDTGNGTGGGVGGGLVFDNFPPETIINNLNQLPTITNQTEITFEFKANEENSIFECQIDDSPWQICFSPKTYQNLSQGNHTFKVRAIDLAGNVDLTPASFSWIIDLTPPILSFDQIFENKYFNLNSWPNKIFGTCLDSNDLAKIEIQIQKGLNSQYLGYLSSTLTWLEEPNWLEVKFEKNFWSFPLPNDLLSDEIYLVRIQASDFLNNTTSSTIQFIFDQTPPEKPSNLEINYNLSKSTIKLNWQESSDNLSGIDFYEINWLNQKDEFSSSTPFNFFNLNAELNQFYLFKIRAVDKSGNKSEWLEKEYKTELPLVGWTKRKVLVIDNTKNENDLTDFEVNVEINYEPEMNNDFSDIRFTDSDGSTILNYGWDINEDGTEKKENGLKATAVVKIPFIPKRSEKIIYLYYGNPSAPSIASLENTLTWFDHFNKKRLNDYDFSPNNAWQWDLSGKGTVSLKSAIDRFIFGTLSPKTIPLKNIQARIYYFLSGDFSSGWWNSSDVILDFTIRANNENSENDFKVQLFKYHGISRSLNVYEVLNGNSRLLFKKDYDKGDYWIFKEISAYENEINWQFKDEIGNFENGNHLSLDLNQPGKIILGTGGYNLNFVLDYLYVRQYTNSMPEIRYEN
jgi:hypothetical protein